MILLALLSLWAVCSVVSSRARCTGARAVPLQGVCMAFASMSQIFQGEQGRREYLCRWCALRSERAPVADSEPLRVLLLHALTAPEGGQDFAVRVKTVRAVVRAPPHKWGCGAQAAHEHEVWDAVPEW